MADAVYQHMKFDEVKQFCGVPWNAAVSTTFIENL